MTKDFGLGDVWNAIADAHNNTGERPKPVPNALPPPTAPTPTKPLPKPRQKRVEPPDKTLLWIPAIGTFIITYFSYQQYNARNFSNPT